MNKILLIIQREYLTRVRKKSFIVMTILGPLLIAGLMLVVFWMGLKESENQKVLVVDDNNPMFFSIKNTKTIQFDYMDITLQQAQNLLHQSDYTSILYLPENILNSKTGKLYFKKQPSQLIQKTIEIKVENILQDEKLKLFKINKDTFKLAKVNFMLSPYKLDETGKGEKVETELTWVGFIFGIFIYMFIFMYGIQVMRGVIEEKTSRIIEIIVCSVKPFQLMMGKIVGVGLVGLTQFLLWIILSGIVFSLLTLLLFHDFYDPSDIQSMQMTPEMMQELQGNGFSQMNLQDPDNILNRINFPMLLGMFLFYFLGGYMLYSALFAAVGAAVDSETDTQQFMLPVTLPLVFAYMISFFVIMNPEGPAAFWFSIIPLTSPIVMMVRLAVGIGDTGVPLWEVGLSMGLLIIGFLCTTWLAAKIYRTGILMYGKKVSWKELWKWLTYKA